MNAKASTGVLFVTMLAFFMPVVCSAEIKHLNARAAKDINTSTLKHSDIVDTSKGKYVNGKKHGIWKTYNTKGQVIKKEKYDDGELIYYIIFNEKHKVIETRDRKGKVRRYEPCNC